MGQPAYDRRSAPPQGAARRSDKRQPWPGSERAATAAVRTRCDGPPYITAMNRGWRQHCVGWVFTYQSACGARHSWVELGTTSTYNANVTAQVVVSEQTPSTTY